MRVIVLLLAVCVFAAGTQGKKRGLGFYSPSKQTQARAEQSKRNEKQILSRIASPDLVKRLEELDIFKRADEDPFCSLDVDCDLTESRKYVDSIEHRTLNGQCNNVDNWSWGVAGIQHDRLLDDVYENGKWSPRANSVTGTNRDPIALPSARNVSNAVHKTTSDKEDNTQGVSLALFYFMQFIDHDIIKTPEGDVPTSRDCCTDDKGFCMPIILTGDDFFEADYCMDARRSFTVLNCDDDSGFQNQINDLTSYIDGSMLYGSSEDEMEAVRSYNGGYLKTSTANFLPEATDTSDQACTNVADPAFCLLTGDTRADVHPSLTMFHTVFMREHNRIAEYLGLVQSDWSDDRIFFEARKIVAAIIQHITLNEMLPKVLDSSVMDDWGLSGTYSYDSTQSASIIQAFSLAYRYHHMMAAEFHMAEVSDSSVDNIVQEEQEDVYENPGYLFESNYKGVEKIALGQVLNGCPMASGKMNDAARNFLFKDSNGDAFDLATLNIMRGREWGTPAYTEYRDGCGLGAATSWSDLLSTHSQDSIDDLSSIYDDVQDVDLWTGIVTEEMLGDSISGPTQSCLVAMQFANLRDGDRFWYETTDADVMFTASQLAEIKKVTLARIMCNNLDVSKMRASVFETDSAWTDCSAITEMDLSEWEP